MIFNNKSITFYTYSSTDSFDVFGEEKGEYTLRETTLANVQPLSMQDSQAVFGKIVKDTYKVYVNKDVEIHDTDIVVLDNETYTIVGAPFVWNHILPHKKIILQKQRVQGFDSI